MRDESEDEINIFDSSGTYNLKNHAMYSVFPQSMLGHESPSNAMTNVVTKIHAELLHLDLDLKPIRNHSRVPDS